MTVKTTAAVKILPQLVAAAVAKAVLKALVSIHRTLTLQKSRRCTQSHRRKALLLPSLPRIHLLLLNMVVLLQTMTSVTAVTWTTFCMVSHLTASAAVIHHSTGMAILQRQTWTSPVVSSQWQKQRALLTTRARSATQPLIKATLEAATKTLRHQQQRHFKCLQKGLGLSLSRKTLRVTNF